MTRRVFFHYREWEDWKHGYYKPGGTDTISVEGARQILADPVQCRDAMLRVVSEWPRTTAQNLSDTSQNRRAWMGRACVCIATGNPEGATRVAWFQLTPMQKEVANRIADSIIADWEARQAGDPCQKNLWDKTF